MADEWLEQNREFFEDLLGDNPTWAKRSSLFKAVATAYRRGMNVQDICDTFGLTRTEMTEIVQLAGVHRHMDSKSMPPEDVANLYSLLYAAQLEINDLRRQLSERD